MDSKKNSGEQKNESTELAKKRLRQLKREIDVEVRIGIKASKNKQEKIREYIDLCYEIYKNEQMPKLELSFLGNAMKQVPIDYKDIAKFGKKCIEIGEYENGMEFIRTMKDGDNVELSIEEYSKVCDLEKSFVRSINVQRAINLINQGNINTDMIKRQTGMSTEQVNFLKYKLLCDKIKFPTVQSREEVLKLLPIRQTFEQIQEKFQVSDLEMEDIKEQKKYRNIRPSNRNVQAQVKQDTLTRLIVLNTKIGKSVEDIATKLDVKPEEVKENIKSALQVSLIKRSQLNGIKLVDLPDLEEKQTEMEK